MKDKTSSFFTSSIHEVVRQKNMTLIKQYLLKSPSLINVEDEKGYTPLGYAVESGDVALVKLLLQYDDPFIHLAQSRLAFLAREHITVRKFLFEEMQGRYTRLNNLPNNFQNKLAKLILATNLSIYYHYETDRSMRHSYYQKELDYAMKAEKFYDEIIKEHDLDQLTLIDLNERMGKNAILLNNDTEIIKHYSLAIHLQSEYLKNEGYQKVSAGKLSHNYIMLMKAYLRHGESFEKIKASNSSKYACENYAKVIETAKNIPDLLSPKQKANIDYYVGIAQRYIGEHREKMGSVREGFTYYLKSIEIQSKALEHVAPEINDQHANILKALTISYNRICALQQKGKLSLTEIQAMISFEKEQEKRIPSLLKIASFKEETLIPDFYRAQQTIDKLLKKSPEGTESILEEIDTNRKMRMELANEFLTAHQKKLTDFFQISPPASQMTKSDLTSRRSELATIFTHSNNLPLVKKIFQELSPETINKIYDKYQEVSSASLDLNTS